jgi:hypothetical protein
MLVLSGAWIGSDRLEQNNDYCNSCHLPGDTPLHVEIRERFDRVVPRNLAGVHGRSWLETREDPAFRCIDCHAGSPVFERFKIKLISARDGARYVTGDFEEPHRMSFDLSVETCQRCHPRFRHSAAPGWTVQAYHGREEHDQERADSPRCVRCHSVHGAEGDPVAYFMNRERVDPQCRACHESGTASKVPSLLKASAG